MILGHEARVADKSLAEVWYNLKLKKCFKQVLQQYLIIIKEWEKKIHKLFVSKNNKSIKKSLREIGQWSLIGLRKLFTGK